MNGGELERRLSAILVADVVGYSRMMGEDDAATLLALQGHRFALVDPTIGQHHGRIVKSMGDGLLVEFPSAHDAVAAATAIQHGMLARNAGRAENRQIRFRIGVNIGDVIVEGADIHGDGVNIAARLQAIAEPDGVCISASILAHVDADFEGEFSDIGAQRFKNIAKPVRAYHWCPDASVRPANAAIRPFIDMPAAEPLLATGRCNCDAIRYEVTQEPLGSMLCHCRICQRFSGAPILGGTTFLTQAFRFTKGEPKFYRSSNIAERGFCGDCGSGLVYRGLIGVWTKWIMVWTGSLDNPERYPPTYHLGTESAMPWLAIHDDLPRTRCKDSPSLIDAYRSVGEEVP